jgi:hypothetical protein
MPPGLACRFTVGELAVLRIVSREWLTWLTRGPKPIGVRKVISRAVAPVRSGLCCRRAAGQFGGAPYP